MFRVANKRCFKIYTTKRIDKTENIFVNTIDCRRPFRYLQILLCNPCIYKNVTLSKSSWNRKALANAYETILDAWEFVIHTSHGTHPLLMRMKIVYTAPIDTIWYSSTPYTKQVSNTDKCEVLVLPVHSQETRLVSFLSRPISFLSGASSEKGDASLETVVTYFWAAL